MHSAGLNASLFTPPLQPCSSHIHQSAQHPPHPVCLCVCVLQLTLPTRSTNMSFLKLTSQNKVPPEQVYKVRDRV